VHAARLALAKAVFYNAVDWVAKVRIIAGNLAPDMFSAELASGTICHKTMALADIAAIPRMFTSTLSCRGRSADVELFLLIELELLEL